MSNQKTAALSRRSPQRATALLTVTLDAEASACVRQFADELGETANDVASATILDALPQSLEAWQKARVQFNVGETNLEHYWIVMLMRVRDARKRRLSSASK